MIGKSVYKRGGNKPNYFYMEPGSNVFRILPPMFSLAPKGQWYKYWAVHKGFVNSAGTYRPLASIEEFDPKTKTIRVHDPVCDKYRENMAKAKAAKDKGVPEDKIKEFLDVYVKPYDTDKKYYVNAVNQDGKIGVLEIPIKLFRQLEALCEEYEAKGIDLTGMKGVFLNFKKVQAYKGDPQTTYSVEIFKETFQKDDGIYEKPKVHEITEAFVVQLESEARDLSTLFKVPTATDLQLLADAEPTARGAIIDRIFGKSESANEEDLVDEDDNTVGAIIPNTGGARVVGQVGLQGANLTVSLPSMPTPGAAGPAVTPQTQDFLKGATKPAPAAASPQAAQAPYTSGDFDKMFESMFGTAK
jgi:hypothetical protein